MTENERQFLQDYPRVIAHLRTQHHAGRFGLILGSGLSRSLGLPMWDQLVDRIANTVEVAAAELFDEVGNSSPIYKAELIFQHFRLRRLTQLNGTPANNGEDQTRKFEFMIKAEWHKIVSDSLYSDLDGDLTNSFEAHDYLKALVQLVAKTKFTVTFNFDNLLEQAVAYFQRDNPDRLTRGYETVTNPWVQFRRQDAVIYHVNGIFPQELMERPVDRMVFSEASYSEEFIGFLTGDHSGLVNHLSKNTCLFIGLSLTDPVMKNILTQNRHANPGGYHYYVHYLNGRDELSDEQKCAIRETNFCVYNLITLFLQKEEINTLLRLINFQTHDDASVRENCQELGVPSKFVFYITGAMGVGKTTTVNNLRNLRVFDEWIDPRPSILGKPWDQLTQEEKANVDEFILGQFATKNKHIGRDENHGILLVDRPPLDPLAFTSVELRPEKARAIKAALSPGAADRRVQSGGVILLLGDHQELCTRLVLTGRSGYDAERVERMEMDLRGVYEDGGVKIVQTRGLSIPEVTRRVARIIYVDPYQEVNLHQRLVEFEAERALT